MPYVARVQYLGMTITTMITEDEMQIEHMWRLTRPRLHQVPDLNGYINQLVRAHPFSQSILYLQDGNGLFNPARLSETAVVHHCLRWLDVMMQNLGDEHFVGAGLAPGLARQLVHIWHNNIRTRGYDDSLVVEAIIKKVAAYQHISIDREAERFAAVGRHLGIEFEHPLVRPFAMLASVFASNERRAAAMAAQNGIAGSEAAGYEAARQSNSDDAVDPALERAIEDNENVSPRFYPGFFSD